MVCVSCQHKYDATNQHSACPKCGKVAGTNAERDLDETLAEVTRWYEGWETGTASSRADAERDRDYKDGKQWTEDEAEVLRRRGQPVVVKNRIFKKINFLLGMEVRNRTDPRALPRTPAHGDDAEAMSDAIRYVVDDQDFDTISSRVWDNTLVEGYGGAVVEHEIMDDPNGERHVEVRLRRVPWDRLWYDVHSREPDFSDARHMGISRWWDLEDAVAYYKKRGDHADNFEEILRGASEQSSQTSTHDDKPRWVQNQTGKRKRIRVSECYYETTDDTGRMRWHVCHYTKSGFIVEPKPTGYLDELDNDVCPLIMSSAFVTRDGARYGLVRHMIGPQDEINKRTSKALHLMSVRQVLAEEGAVLNPDEARTELAKPDGWIELQRDALVTGRMQISQTGDLAAGQVSLLQEAKMEIDTIGPEIPQIGATSGSSSGRALMMRQQIGSLEIAPIEDNHKAWKRRVYQHVWWRIRQFMPHEWWFRVTDDASRKGFRFVGLNRRMTRGQRLLELLQKEVPLESAVAGVLTSGLAQVVLNQAAQAVQAQVQQLPPEIQQQISPDQIQAQTTQLLLQHPSMAEAFTAADVAKLSVDIVIDEAPDTAILQQEEFEAIGQMMPSFLQAKPDMAPQLLELMLELSQHRFKRRVLEMLRQAPDPQQVQAQQTMRQLQEAQAQAGLEVAKSQAQLNAARAAKEQTEAQVVGMTADIDATKTESEIEKNKALAMHHAANAGHKAGADL